ncbi:MAG: hypothetical protein ABIQ81_04765, partial [Novosphingobium sp.]
QEGLVPLVTIEGSAARTLDWNGSLAANHNRLSHYRIFPTLLTLMGYDAAQVAPVYGATLTAPASDPFTFNSRFNARLGRAPVWRHIDLRTIQPPPPDTN